jgi:hypothetical protein
MTGVKGGLILAANCGENLLMVRVAFSLKDPAKLSFRNATLSAVKSAERMARGLVRNPNPSVKTIMMK